MRKTTAFTLIELMVTIAIMALLAAVSIPNFRRSISKGRDAQQKSDISEVQQALVAYRAEYAAYPSSGGSDAYASYAGLNSTLIDQKFLSSLPGTDREGDKRYAYTPGNCDTGGCKTFVLCTGKMEAGEGNSTSNTSLSACPAGTSCDYYCVTNP